MSVKSLETDRHTSTGVGEEVAVASMEALKKTPPLRFCSQDAERTPQRGVVFELHRHQSHRRKDGKHGGQWGAGG